MQIDDAQRILCGDSSEHPRLNNNPTVQAASPTSRCDKRRHSLVTSVDSTATPKQGVARSKTLTTYSTKKPSSSNQERDQFLARFGEDAVMPNTSTPVKFSDHSRLGSSGVSPTGSIQDDFINHEPAMFRESGSTVPDNESSHDRMLEQALQNRPSKDTSSPGRIKLVESTDTAKSSSFPWSASDATESAKSHRVQGVQYPTVVAKMYANPGSQQTTGHEDDRLGLHGSTVPDSNETSAMGHTSADTSVLNQGAVAPESSPTVEIATGGAKAPLLKESAADSAASAQKSGRGRKRKVQEESSEPLNSDDIAVGLPRERYKPRPSRRRATHVAEEIDYSVVPEKAARTKRAKSTGSVLASMHDELGVSTEQQAVSTKDRSGISRLSNDPDPAVAETCAPPEGDDDTTMLVAPPKPSPVVEVPAIVKSQPQQLTPAKPVATASQSSRESPSDDTSFTKQEPRTKSTSKSKRSFTTIFEDHVDFRGKQQSPSLSQQQAIRKSAVALGDVKNEATPATSRRGRKIVIPDDEEDELSYDPAPPGEPIKKRGRGRPPKSTTNAIADRPQKPIAKGAVDENDGEDMPEQPPKKRRGRPPKSAATVPAVEESAATTNKSEFKDHVPNEEIEEEEEEEEAQEPAKEEPDAATSIETTDKETTPTATTIASNIPTPSPEKQNLAKESTAAPTSKPTKTSPTTHSPIKNSSPAPYRVGLSKKHRIPSLLRVMRPPPPKRG